MDVVFKFIYDPRVLVPAKVEAGPGGAGLVRTTGVRRPGEYWVRLTGRVPAGQGRIVAFPFILRSGATVPASLGEVTLYTIGG